VTVLVLAVVLGALATLVARALGPRIGLVSKPNPLVAQHVAPTPSSGGLGIAAGTLGALAASAPGELASSWRLLGPALLFLLVGVIDDARPLSAAGKLLSQAAIALLAVVLGAGFALTGNAWIDGMLSLGWIVVVVNAFNVLDVCDGLLAGASALSFGAIALAFPEVRALALAIAGACVGFLAFNRPRATIFLGDGGSHFLGFLAAAIAFAPGAQRVDARDIATAGLLLALPLFETGLLVYARNARGLPWWRGSRDHFSLRLQARGWSRWRTVLLAWGVAGALAAAGVAVHALPQAAGWAAILGALALGVVVGNVLGRHTEPLLR
jgi:UDP-GlcNAc:undecaprenyl-phosphate GlcNAc-1-phosphate transferase